MTRRFPRLTSIPSILLTLLAGGFLTSASCTIVEHDRPGNGSAPGLAVTAATAPQSVQPFIETLTREGERGLRNRVLPRQSADFASEVSNEVNLDDIARAITQRQHRDPFVDAYIRWQLTSFEPMMPEMTPPDFTRMINLLPPYLENPAANENVRQLMNRARDAGQLSARDIARLEEVYREMKENVEMANNMNQPAAEFRDWIAAQYEHDHMRALLLALAECTATVAGGWSTRSIKTQITRMTTEAGKDPDFSRQDRRVIAEQIQRLVGIERRMVNEVTFLADGSVNVTFSTAAVTRRDSNNWIDRLHGRHENAQSNDS
ncbi:MAG: hypothetical protein EA377_04500 [Phycisphaerales bacterium]|nr:MAG: hypothetical protein EA377_04500 [Phycisphaerales bacterium]